MSDNLDLVKVLLEEYRIIQGKIDKIGEFEFKVRGWAITLESALFISLLTEKIAKPYFWYIFILMAAIIFIFQFMEQEQKEVRRSLAERALKIEPAIDRLVISRDEDEKKKAAFDKVVFKKIEGCPRLAVTLRNYGRNRTKTAFKSMFRLKTHVFYIAQYIFLIITLIIFLVNHMVDDKSADGKDKQFKIYSLDFKIESSSLDGAIDGTIDIREFKK